MILSPYEYISHMERLGLFSAEACVPDQNTGVWKVYLDMYQSLIGGVQDIQIIATPGGLGFYKDPLDGRDIYTWALLGPISHPILPFSPAELIERAGTILDGFARAGIAEPAVITETFELSKAPDNGLENHFLWINSPRARIHDVFDEYVKSLASSRRKWMRELFQSFDGGDFRFELTTQRPDTRETDFMVKSLHKRWGDDMAYALVQSLWPMAVSTVMPERARFMRVYHQGTLAFLNAFILRDEVIISQATCKNEELFFSGLGVMIDFKAVQLLGGSGLRHLDPTCRTSIEDPETIGVAKRKVVNENARKPVLLAGYRLPALDVAYPYLDPVQGWVVPGTVALTGRPA